MSEGYSGTPLPRKLGLKDGQRALFIGLPDTLAALARSAAFSACEMRASVPKALPQGLDVVHLFVTEARVLEEALPRLRAALDPAGMIWVSWPKKASKVDTDITEDTIRAIALPDLVDIKVCAVDAVWSGLKLVIPKARRGR